MIKWARARLESRCYSKCFFPLSFHQSRGKGDTGEGEILSSRHSLICHWRKEPLFPFSFFFFFFCFNIDEMLFDHSWQLRWRKTVVFFVEEPFYISAAEIPLRVSYRIKDGHWSAELDSLTHFIATLHNNIPHIKSSHHETNLNENWKHQRKWENQRDECWVGSEMVSHGVMLYFSKEMLEEEVSMSKDQIRRQASVSGESNDDQVCCC